MVKGRQIWRKEEEEALYEGIKRHGASNWKRILSDPQLASSLANRSNINLKDKWRTLTGSCNGSDARKKVTTLRKEHLMHPPPRPRKRSRKKRVVEEQSDSEDNDKPCTVTLQRRGSRSRNNLINQARKLDSEKVQSYLENLWLSFPEDKKSAFTHLDPLWYTLYSSGSRKEKVLNWIKKKDIFSKKYVFFPIVQWSHWSVLIFCHFGESLGSKLRTPCILLLDSLAEADHSKQQEPLVRKFVLDIYENLERTEDKVLLRKMPFLVPKVPQQRNGEECGFLVLYYIKLFVESAPEGFSATNGYPYFMKKDWFNSEGLDNFCRTLNALEQCNVLHENVRSCLELCGYFYDEFWWEMGVLLMRRIIDHTIDHLAYTEVVILSGLLGRT